MHLIIFDIDGTLVDSVQVDDDCFKKAFLHLHQLDISNLDWDDFKNVTDSGLTNDIFNIHFKRLPTLHEVLELKTYFYQLLAGKIDEMPEVKGAKDALFSLVNHLEFTIAFATGGWRETALLKLSVIDFELGDLSLVSANEHFNRAEIIKLAISASQARLGLEKFDSITYIGDGLWDYKATKELGINFIGIDYTGNGKLIQAGVTQVVSDFSNFTEIVNWVQNSSAPM